MAGELRSSRRLCMLFFFFVFDQNLGLLRKYAYLLVGSSFVIRKISVVLSGNASSRQNLYENMGPHGVPCSRCFFFLLFCKYLYVAVFVQNPERGIVSAITTFQKSRLGAISPNPREIANVFFLRVLKVRH